MVERVVIPFSAAVIAAAIWVFLILWYTPHPIGDFNRLVWPEEVRAGEEINIKASVTRTKGGCSSIVTRRWVNEAGIDIVPAQHQAIPELPAGGETFIAKIKIPEEAKPGNLVMRNSVEFFCNPVQRLFGGTTLPLHDLILTVLP